MKSIRYIVVLTLLTLAVACGSPVTVLEVATDDSSLCPQAQCNACKALAQDCLPDHIICQQVQVSSCLCSHLDGACDGCLTCRQWAAAQCNPSDATCYFTHFWSCLCDPPPVE